MPAVAAASRCNVPANANPLNPCPVNAMNSQSLAIDHLMWGGADLDSAIDILASHTGCRAAAGGSHPGNGTRNALLGLGGERYLEVIAPDPTQSAGAGLAAELAAMRQPALWTWAVRTGSLEAVAAQLNAHGISTASPRAMSRRAIDGTLLQWRLLFAQDRSLGGVLPFFIDWGNSAHPTTTLGRECRLDALHVTLPAGHVLAGWFASIDGVRVETGAQPGLQALLVTPRGRVDLD